MKEKPKKLNVKKIILVGLGILAGLIVVWAIGVWIFFLATFTTYHNEKDGVDISYPKTWTVKEYPATDVIVAFVSPKENALDTFSENVNLSTYDMSALPHSTEDYVKILVDQLLMIFSDFQLVQKLPFPVAGQNGYRMVLSMGTDQVKMIVVYAFTIETTGYNILYIGTKERYARDQFLMDVMALSLKVRYWARQ
jgi:hypothetical protein